MSHQQSRLTWVAGAFLFSERDDQSLLSPQRPASLEIRLHPRVDPGVYDIRNAASATIRGVEVENTSRLVTEWRPEDT